MFYDFIELITDELLDFLELLTGYLVQFLSNSYDKICTIGDNALSKFLMLFIDYDLASLFSSDFFFFIIGLFTIVFVVNLIRNIIGLVI